MRISIAVAGVAAAALVVAGCSFSDSSKSISESISSPIVSISGSSSPEDDYEEEVRDFTASHVRSGGSAADLRARIADLSEKDGVSDWESDAGTWKAIGAGIAKAGYNATERDAFVMNLAPNGKQHTWIFKGYGDYAP